MEGEEKESGKWDGSMGVGVGGGGESEGVQRLRQRWADRRSGAVPLRSAWRPLGVNRPAAPLTAILFEVCRHLLFSHFTHKPRMHHSKGQLKSLSLFLLHNWFASFICIFAMNLANWQCLQFVEMSYKLLHHRPPKYFNDLIERFDSIICPMAELFCNFAGITYYGK